MHNHSGASVVSIGPENSSIVLAGNPNTGKSVIFGYLTHSFAEVSNYPGTTVDVHRGSYKGDAVLDTPGVYGISAFSEEERVTRDIVLVADRIVNVVDASHLRRDLFLTLQLADMGLPMIVALNMMDDASSAGLQVDVDGLSKLLGVPVIPTVATKKSGLEELASSLPEARPGIADSVVESQLADQATGGGANGGTNGISRAEAVLSTETVDVGRTVEMRDEIYRRRRERANSIYDQVVTATPQEKTIRYRLGYWMIQPLTGIPVLLMILAALYLLLGELVAVRLVGFTEGVLAQEHWTPWISGLVEQLFDGGSAIGQLLIGEYGLLSMTVTYLFAVILPLVLVFYLAMALLEDSGYLPRVAVLFDTLMQRIGLNGRAVIPMILGLGCITMATISTRILTTRRERMIVTYLMALAIPCSAQLGVILGILAIMGGWTYAVIYGAVLLTTMGISGALLSRMLPGESIPLLLDLPPVRMPHLRNVLKKTMQRSIGFMKEVAIFFAAGAVLLATMDMTGLLTKVVNALAPITTSWLKLPAEVSTAFVMGFVRRDFGAAGLYGEDGLGLGMTPTQALVALVTITFFVPCIAALLIIFKERGRVYTVAAWTGTVLTAFFVAGVVAQVMDLVTS